MQLGKVTPILRIFDEAKALEFYVDFLGFKVDWQHRFEADFPLYLQVSLGEFAENSYQFDEVHLDNNALRPERITRIPHD